MQMLNILEYLTDENRVKTKPEIFNLSSIMLHLYIICKGNIDKMWTINIMVKQGILQTIDHPNKYNWQPAQPSQGFEPVPTASLLFPMLAGSLWIA